MSLTRRVVLVVLLAALLAGGLVYFHYSQDIERARAAVTKDAHIVQTSAGPIQYGERGAGTPLLSIHGAGGGYDQGLANAVDFVGSGFRIIAPSRFGYLGTPVPADPSAEAQADAHAALLDALGLDEAVVVGISAGARSAIASALHHPERVSALILIVPASFEPSDPVAIEESRGSKLAFWLVNAGADFAWWALETVAPSVLIRFIGVPPEVVGAASKAEQERVQRIVRSIQPLSKRVRGINLDSIPDGFPPLLERITAPTIVVSAQDDLFNTLPAARLAASRIPNARLKVFETGGHLLVGHQQDVRDLVGEFVDVAGIR
ncbi:MAG: alpha/beta hydrolase [Rhodospirillales bacterium]|nr:alpha/beta hydrolase [Rhodospirillales bacterium]